MRNGFVPYQPSAVTFRKVFKNVFHMKGSKCVGLKTFHELQKKSRNVDWDSKKTTAQNK